MLIEFSISNYRSFDEMQTLSFRATSLKSDDAEVDAKNTIELDKYQLLKIVGVYGANGSGKSNLIKGLAMFQEMVWDSLFRDEVGERNFEPFRSNAGLQDHIAMFQIMLLLGGKKYRYGFSLAWDGTLQKEWLYGPADKNDTFYFQRTGSDIQINEERFPEGQQLPFDKLRDDALFLTFCASFDGEISARVRDYITKSIYIDMNHPATTLRSNSARRAATDELISAGKKDVVLNWLAEAGLAYNDVQLRKGETEVRRSINYVELVKPLYNETGEMIGDAIMDLDLDESEGTRKFYRLIGRLYHLFQNGGCFASDEIDSNFHPFLLLKLIKLFQNPKVNVAGAQLLFTSHDTNLMNPEYMRRDQFYFTEKTLRDCTRLYSMADLKGIRNNADFARQYLAGFYGGLPHLANCLQENG